MLGSITFFFVYIPAHPKRRGDDVLLGFAQILISKMPSNACVDIVNVIMFKTKDTLVRMKL